MPNYNAETGIPYGVVNANACPDLFDDIVSSGESITFREYLAEFVAEIKGALRAIADKRAHDADRVTAAIDCEALAQSMLDAGCNDSLDFQEDEFEHTEKIGEHTVKYLLSYLGGAPLIWVCDSPYLAYASPCSPCVPGAGDLDTIASAGTLCYCVPPDAFDEEQGKYEIIGQTTVNGRTYEIVGKAS